jgi:hypothetical protein
MGFLLQCTRCRPSVVSLGNNIFPNGVIKFQDRRFIFQDCNYKDGPLNFLFPFLKYILYLGLRFGEFLLGLCNSNLN